MRKIFALIGLLALGLVLFGCAQAPAPTPTPLPTIISTPTLPPATPTPEATPIATPTLPPATPTPTPTPVPQVVQVAIRNFAFDPNIVTIPLGSTVVWTNYDDSYHTVTSNVPGKIGVASGVFDSDDVLGHNMHQFDKYNFTFTQPGTYEYSCKVHGPRMTGKVIVTG